jgi:hypothetical protein
MKHGDNRNLQLGPQALRWLSNVEVQIVGVLGPFNFVI